MFQIGQGRDIRGRAAKRGRRPAIRALHAVLLGRNSLRALGGYRGAAIAA